MQGGADRSRTGILLTLSCVYALTLLLEAWWPYNFSFPAASADESARQIAWLPFSSAWAHHRIDLEGFARKLSEFIPVGILLAGLCDLRRGARAVLLRTLLAAAGLGLLIQTGRYFLAGRLIDSGDIVLNVLGALLGASPAFYVHLSRRTLGLLTLACAAVFLIAATSPWRFSLEAATPAALSARVEWSLYRGTVALGMWRERALNGLMTLPLGLLYGTYALRRLPVRQVLGQTALVGLACSASVEFLQCFLPHRIPSLPDVYLNTLGALAGGAVAFYFDRWRLSGAETGDRTTRPTSAR